MKLQSAVGCVIMLLLVCCSPAVPDSLSRTYDNRALRTLLGMAKTAIREEFASHTASGFREITYTDNDLGVFLRIINHGQDRGCIGFYHGVGSPEQAIRTAAIDAAFFDDRYPPLRREELAFCELEITVIGRLVPLHDPFDFDLTTHMLRIELDNREAMLQPQIAAQYGYDKQAFLGALCRKAGLEPEAYLDPHARLYKAQAVHLRLRWTKL